MLQIRALILSMVKINQSHPNKEIQQKYSGQGEKKLTQHLLIVDGFAPATNEVLNLMVVFGTDATSVQQILTAVPKKFIQ